MHAPYKHNLTNSIIVIVDGDRVEPGEGGRVHLIGEGPPEDLAALVIHLLGKLYILHGI